MTSQGLTSEIRAASKARNLKRWLAGFAIAALAASAGDVYLAAAHRNAAQRAIHWQNEAKAEAMERAALEQVAEDRRAELDTEKERAGKAQAALDEQAAAHLRSLKRLAEMDAELEAAGFESVSAALAHVYLHERQASDLARWWNWEKRDSMACMCKLGGDRNCDSTKVDYGGEVRP